MAASPMAGAVTFDNVVWDREAEEAEEKELIAKVLGGGMMPGDEALDLDGPRDMGEKADDAEDFEDISDDDLPDEEEAINGHTDVPGLTDDAGTSNDTDDLFGEGGSSPLGDDMHGESYVEPQILSEDHALEKQADYDMNFPEHYGTDNQDPNIPAPAESEEELLKQTFPAFRSDYGPQYWNDILGSKNAYLVPKEPNKPPKPLNLAKVSLEIAPDQEKSFRSAGGAQSAKKKRFSEPETRGIIHIYEESEEEQSDDEDFNWIPPNELETVGGFSFADFQLACEDWDSIINARPLEPLVQKELPNAPLTEWEKNWENEILGPDAKRQKVEHREPSMFDIPRFEAPDFDDFEAQTRRIAKRVILDLNDPYLLLDIREGVAPAKRQKLGANGNYKRSGKGGFSSGLSKRFNLSNDDAYDALKENHQSKIRAVIGNQSVEHSMPALKLQWPYYRVELSVKEARSYHRPPLHVGRIFGHNVYFSKPAMRKRKALKSLAPQEIFAKTEDLSLADHYSSATLFEYSEEHPTVLSNFGMGNRVVNYYRRKTQDDPERPAPEDKVGEAVVLLPEDRSPFANFGMVDPGETVRALHNSMYRAPIFKHEPKNTDFIIIRSTTGMKGNTWHIRNIDNLFVVGQQYPSMEIPGPHSRKVTNASKNRMKMIAYRKIRHSKHRHLKIGDITAHIPGSSDMQNRQKLKEFITYDKTEKVWHLNEGATMPEEASIRSMVKPEEVCVIDAMQVGARHLEDAGYAVDGDDDDADAEEHGTKKKKDNDKGTNLEQDLAPWRTSKAFLDAAADKAMLQLHGEGDPSGHGLAFSFIKTSMKGGFLNTVRGGPTASSNSAMEAEKEAQKKLNGGHAYNVNHQKAIYNESIRDIWERQKTNLSDPTEHAGDGMDLDDEEDRGAERSQYGGRFDESASQFSVDSQKGPSQSMRIIRKIKADDFDNTKEDVEVVSDPRVWREYLKRRAAIELANQNVYDLTPTGNPILDKQKMVLAMEEQQRVQRNLERRKHRENLKAKQAGRLDSVEPKHEGADSPAGTPVPTVPSAPKSTGTARKCANCGQVGHIKTNKKYCPDCE